MDSATASSWLDPILASLAEVFKLSAETLGHQSIEVHFGSGG
jgi:hypothetical protein